MQCRVLFLAIIFAFISTQLCASSVYNVLDNFVSIDYVKEKYPNIDIKSLRFDAKSDNATAPSMIKIESGAAKWFFVLY